MSDWIPRTRTGRPGGALFWTAAGLVLFAAVTRLVPHPWNVTPVAAMALFGGMVMRRPLFALGVPLAAMALSDLGLNLAARVAGAPLLPPDAWVYASFVMIGLLGFLLGQRRRGIATVAAGSVGGSVLFFVVTNFGVWAAGLIYPRTLEGLAACYTAALPFFRQTLVGDLLWNAVLFGCYVALTRRLAVERAEVTS